MSDHLIPVRTNDRLRSAVQSRAANQLSDTAQSEHRSGWRSLADIVNDAGAASLDTIELFGQALREAGGEVEFRETITIIED